MSALAAVLVGILVFAYIEFAIFTGYYMFLKTKGEKQEKPDKQLIKYSIIAGVVFPITFAIIAAYRAAERKK